MPSTKPGYNVQIATENQYIVNYGLYWRPTDYGTLVPFLQSFYNKYGFFSGEIVADSGYGSERGLMHRSNRPIEPEACFGNIKFNHGFKRFRLKSTRKTKVEWGLVSLAHNLRKYVAYKAESKHKQAQSMALAAEKPAMMSAV